MNIFLGLGNPGEEYKFTRHNMGRIILEFWRKELKFPEFVFDKKINALKSEGKIGKEKVILICPETFMNNSGKTVKELKISSKNLEKLVVIYDDLDLPFLKTKFSFDKSSGGHNGLASIIKALKSTKFNRLRVGISPKSLTGKIKKPASKEAVGKLIMKDFNEDDMKDIKKLSKKISEAFNIFLKDGYEKTASFIN